MLSIDDKVISAQDISSKFKVFSNTSYLKAQKGSVAVCIESVTDWLSLCFYAKEAGLTVMPIHASTPEALAKKYADRAGCYALIYQTLDNVTLFPENEAPDTAPGLIQMSSGTTGDPKSIKRSWRSIDQEVSAYVSHFSAPNSMTPVIACPVTHSYGLICGIFVGLARGKHPRVFTSINPKHLLKALLKLEQPLLYSSPLMIDTICMLWPNNSKLHAVMTSGTLMSGPVFERTKSKIKHFYQQYGCSEAGCVAISKTFDRANVIGEVLPHVTVKAGDNSKAPSEMVIKVKQPLDGQVSEIHTSDLGYFETIDGRRQLCFVARQDDTIIVSGLNVYPKDSDLGYFETIDGRRQLCFVARQDDTIIVSGLNVYPKDVEDIVLTHPHIKDAVLFKVKDHSTGYRAYLQFCASRRYTNEDKAALKRWCHQHLATYQVPFDFVQVDAINRLPNGKVNRKAIAESYQLEAETQAVTA